MALDLAGWKSQLPESLFRLKRDVKRFGPGALYAALSTAALWPVAQAMGSDGIVAGASALATISANVGANLIASKLWDLKGKAEEEARDELEQWIGNNVQQDAELRAALDEILVKLEALKLAQFTLSETDKAWFVDVLRSETQLIGSSLVVTINTGSVYTVQGPATVVQGDAYAGDKIIGTVIQSLVVHTGKADPVDERGWLASYLRAVIADCSRLKLEAIDDSATRVDGDSPRRKPPQLSDVYVDLYTQLRIPADTLSLADYFQGLADLKAQLPKDGIDGLKLPNLDEKMRRVSVLEAFAYHREIVLLGRPGSGKSTFASFVALNLARAAFGQQGAMHQLGDHWNAGLLLPIRVLLRQFAQQLAESTSEGHAGDLWEFIRREIRKDAGPLDREADVVEKLAKGSGALFILDGLDEASTPDLRKRVLAAVDDFKSKSHENSRFLVTARPYAWSTPVAERGEYEVADFDDDQVRLFTRRWYDALVSWGWLLKSEAEEKHDNLVPASQRHDLRPLAANPLLLTLMATLNTNRVRLPDDRADLYDEVVDLLLERWNQRKGKDMSLLEQLNVPGLTIANLRDVVESIAYGVHQAHEGKDGTADIDELTLINAFLPLLGSLDKARNVVNYIDERAGLLISQGARVHDQVGGPKFTFPHRTFQEFLAGCYLPRLTDFSATVCTLAKRNAAHWRLALTFAARLAKTERGTSASDALVRSQEFRIFSGQIQMTETDAMCAMVAADQILEIGLPAVNSNEQGREIKNRVASWVTGALRQMNQPKQRAEAGRLLSLLGDPRPGVLSVEEMPLCYVPAGEFVMGGDGERDGKPVHLQKQAHGFWLGKYPVTNAQYHMFVRNGGYEDVDLWNEAVLAKRWIGGQFRGWNDEWRAEPRIFRAPFSYANHPVIGVSWYEALAFSRWMSKALHCGTFRLPTEAEIEYASRGPRYTPSKPSECCRAANTIANTSDSELASFREVVAQRRSSVENRRVYPWGNEANTDNMNYDKSGIGTTSAVGAFPSGTSMFGCEDLSGNVWEWTMTKMTKGYEDYDSTVDNGPTASETGRVVRGGGFDGTEDFARVAYRYSFEEGRDSGFIGFRVAMLPRDTGQIHR